MSRYFGPIMQNGFAVHDWRAAAEHWITTMGVGPFFLMQHIRIRLVRIPRRAGGAGPVRGHRLHGRPTD